MQLSDASGVFAATPTTLTTVSQTAGSSITATIPAGTTSGIGYKVRVVNDNGGTPVTGSASSAFTIVNNPMVTLTGTTTQTIQVNTNGTALGYTDSPISATAHKWQFSTTQGGPYADFTPAQTGTTYTPNFSSAATYYVVEVSTFPGCGAVTSNEAVITVTPPPSGTINTPTFPSGTLCATTATSVDVTFTASGTFNAGNIFTVQLSNASGSFATPVSTVSVSNTSTTAQTLTLPIPAGTPTGSGYKVRVISSDPVTTSSGTSASLSIVSNPTVTLTGNTTQTILVNTNGTVLGTTETPTATSRKWQFSTTQGGPYADFSPTQTGATYTPRFAATGTYYVVAVSNFPGCGAVTSNEAVISVNNPAPTLTAQSVNTAVAGSAGFTLNLTGTGFINGVSVANFGGTALATTASSGTQIAATVPASLLTTPGSYNVTVTNPAPGGGTSAALTFTVTQAPCLAESFDGTFPPSGWSASGVTQGTGTTRNSSAGSAQFSAPGQTLTTPSLAYPKSVEFYITRSSSLNERGILVKASTDNGVTFATVATFVLADISTSFQKKTVDLAAYQLRPSVLIRFERSADPSLNQLNIDDFAAFCGAAPTLAAEPTAQPTVSSSNVLFTRADVSVNGGDGAKQVVVLRATSVAAVAPADGNTYVGNTTYGSTGTGSVTGMGNYVVYAGPTGSAPNTFTVTGLPSGTNFTLEAYAYNDNGTAGLENYLTTIPGTNTFSTGVAPTVYYAKATGDIGLATTYAENADGTGSSPDDFTAPGITYVVTGTGRTFVSNFTLSAAGSKLAVANGAELIIPAAANYTGTLDLNAGSLLTVLNTAPTYTLGTVDGTSTINYAQSATYVVPVLASPGYGNLKLTNGTKTFAGGTITVRGNLTVENVSGLGGTSSTPFTIISLDGNYTQLGTVTFAATANLFTLQLDGNSVQTLTGNGTAITLFRLINNNTAGAVLSTTGGSTNLVLGNSTSGNLTQNSGTSLAINANTVTLTGSASFSGTGVLTNTSTGSVIISKTNTSNSGLLYLGAGETLGTLTINPSGLASTLTLGSTNVAVNNLNLTAGTLVLNGKTLTINGTVTTGAAAVAKIQGSASSSLVFTGTGNIGTLNFTATAGSTLAALTLNRSANTLIPVGSTLTIGTLTLTQGSLLFSGSERAIVTTVVGGNANSFVNALTLTTPAATTASFTFPLGSVRGHFRPLTLDLTQAAAVVTAYTARQIDRTSPETRAATSPLTRTSSIRYFTLSSEGATFTTGTLTLSFGANDGVTDLASLRIGRSSGGAFTEVSATPTTTGAPAGGTIASTITALGDFALATVATAASENPLPVELKSFTGELTAEGTLLRWTTASEKNNDRFEVLRSLDGREFSRVGEVKGQGSTASPTDYRFVDATRPQFGGSIGSSSGTAYYRLRQVDIDGTAKLSAIVVVGGESKAPVTLYPNPTTDRLTLQTAAGVQWQIRNGLGQALLHGTTTGTTTLDVTRLPAGVYYLETRTDTQRHTQKFVKQ
ncbi:T9SS type A sorting domain-containing protein [Hymenobacter busanensis]|uniref:T9SS type A sorting domain-containing protein n=1 Tax=Hymenobacter busanensis TaxID=2607656 RepID=UPI001366D3C0|nr:T9SS type A sorting domain-containing protein [Hymenobacter busanensis]QHJ05853.1 T9SS type A sorting domain-containing protein [Hymenobacter busanensis]